MKEEDIVVKEPAGEIDGVDVVGVLVGGVFNKGDVEGKIQAAAVVDQSPLLVAGGHDHLLDSLLSQESQLTAENRLPWGESRQAFRLMGGEIPHAASHTGI